MKRIYRAWIFCIAILLFLAGPPAAAITVEAGGSIQDAIDTAEENGEISVAAGTYREHLVIDKPLLLRAEGTVVIDAGGSGSAVLITADGVEFEGFAVTNASASLGNAGIRITSDNNRIANVTAVANGDCGIYLYGADGNRLDGIDASENGRSGIWLEASVGNNLENIRGEGNWWDCISIVSSHENTIASVVAAENTFAIWYTWSDDPNILAALSASTNGRLREDSFSAFSPVIRGINPEAVASTSNSVEGLYAVRNYVGICLRAAEGNTITASRITECDPTGSNGCGIWIDGAGGNLLYNNYFNNTRNIVISSGSVNTWNCTPAEGLNIADGAVLGGNYWATPDGTGFSEVTADADGDGFCDEPFVMDEVNIDMLPLKAASGTAGIAAAFSANPLSGYAPLTVQFHDESTGPVAAWSWDFGDGTGSDIRHPAHEYAESGTYTVTLAVKDTEGGEATLTREGYIEVLPAATDPEGPEVPDDPDDADDDDDDADDSGGCTDPRGEISALIDAVGQLDTKYSVKVVLTANLRSARYSLDHDHDRVAILKLEHFTKMVALFEEHGWLDSADANYLTARATAIIAAIGGGTTAAAGQSGCTGCTGCDGECDSGGGSGDDAGGTTTETGGGDDSTEKQAASGNSGKEKAAGSNGKGDDTKSNTGGKSEKDKSNNGNGNSGTGGKGGKSGK